ncbi:hypothetical protein GCM10010378_30790 [Streptomyces viridochromogenes]
MTRPTGSGEKAVTTRPEQPHRGHEAATSRALPSARTVRKAHHTETALSQSLGRDTAAFQQKIHRVLDVLDQDLVGTFASGRPAREHAECHPLDDVTNEAARHLQRPPAPSRPRADGLAPRPSARPSAVRGRVAR